MESQRTLVVRPFNMVRNRTVRALLRQPNQSRLRTKIIRLEGKPDSRHPLKNRIAALAMFAVEQYARQVGSQWLEIQEPAPGAMKIYQELGFQFDAFGRLVIALKKS